MRKNLEESWNEMTAATYNILQETISNHPGIKNKDKLGSGYAFRILCELYSNRKSITASDILLLGKEALIGLEALANTGIIELGDPFGEVRLSEIGYQFLLDFDVKLRSKLNRGLLDYKRSNN